MYRDKDILNKLKEIYIKQRDCFCQYLDMTKHQNMKLKEKDLDAVFKILKLKENLIEVIKKYNGEIKSLKQFISKERCGLTVEKKEIEINQSIDEIKSLLEETKLIEQENQELLKKYMDKLKTSNRFFWKKS